MPKIDLSTCVAVVTAFLSVGAGYVELDALPLDVRLLVVGGLSLAAFVAALERLSRFSKRMVGFANESDRLRSTAVLTTVSSLVLAGVVVLAVLLLCSTTTYHNALVVRHEFENQSGVVRYKILPPHMPADLEIEVYVKPPAEIVKLVPRLDPQSISLVSEDVSKHSMTLVLDDFRRPQQVQLDFTLSAGTSSDALRFNVRPGPGYELLNILEGDQVSTYRLIFLTLGGVMWLFGVYCFYVRFSSR